MRCLSRVIDANFSGRYFWISFAACNASFKFARRTHALRFGNLSKSDGTANRQQRHPHHSLHVCPLDLAGIRREYMFARLIALSFRNYYELSQQI